jgi:hypothetical protein
MAGAYLMRLPLMFILCTPSDAGIELGNLFP